ncbi:MAG: leucine-rich repeat domain-containing protein [Treponema sp.]|nr:leucine-rich repeat domain-containing protein [Treponema sp.]
MTCLSLERVTIPNTVTTIGDSAFSGCANLTTIVIPNSVKTIGNNAFSTSGLTNITIGTGITRIGTAAFAMTQLKTLIINAATPPALGSNLFRHPNLDIVGTVQIKVPSARVNQYKTSDWSIYAERISAQ